MILRNDSFDLHFLPTWECFVVDLEFLHALGPLFTCHFYMLFFHVIHGMRGLKRYDLFKPNGE